MSPRGMLRLPAVIWILVTALGTPLAADDAVCDDLLRDADVAVRSAQYERSLDLLAVAEGRVPACQARIAVLRAAVYNSRAEAKKALAEAATALAATDDPVVLAEAHYQAGRAHYRGQSRSAKKARPAEEAFQRALEVSHGRHEMANRMLMRLYEGTGQAEKLAALRTAHPEIRIPSRLPPPKPKADKAVRPRFVRRASGDVEGPEGLHAPTFRAVTMPGYTDAAREAGVEGSVIVELAVDAEGAVEAVKLLTPLHPDLDAATVAAAEAARLAPATDADESPVACTLVVEVPFRLPAD